MKELLQNSDNIKWPKALYLSLISIFLFYFFSLLKVKLSLPIHYDEVSYLYDITFNRLALIKGDLTSIHVPITNTLDSLILSFLTLLFPEHLASVTVNLIYLAITSYIIYKSRGFEILVLFSAFMLFSNITLDLATEYTSEFKTALLLASFICASFTNTADIYSKKLLTINTFLLIGVRTINLVFVIGFTVYFLFSRYILHRNKSNKHNDHNIHAVFKGLLISIPFLIYTLPNQVSYSYTNNIYLKNVWLEMSGINSRIENIALLFKHSASYFSTITIFLAIVSVLCFIINSQKFKALKIGREYIIHHLLSALLVFSALGLASYSNFKITIWIYASITIFLSLIGASLLSLIKLRSIWIILITIPFLHHTHQEYTASITKLKTSYNKVLKITQNDIIHKLNSSSTNNLTLLKNFYGIAPLDHTGIYLATGGQMTIINPSYNYFTYDTSNIIKSFSNTDYYMAIHNTNLIPPSIPVNKMTHTIDSIFHEDFQEQFELIETYDLTSDKIIDLTLYKRLNMDIDFKWPGDGWIDTLTTINIDSLILQKEVSISMDMNIPIELFSTPRALRDSSIVFSLVNPISNSVISTQSIPINTTKSISPYTLIFSMNHAAFTCNKCSQLSLISSTSLSLENDRRALVARISDFKLIIH